MADKKPQKPMTPEEFQLANAQLMEYLGQQQFSSIEEMNAFIEKHVTGKRIDEIIPKKKGRKSKAEKSDELLMRAYAEDNEADKLMLAYEAMEMNPKNARAMILCAELLENHDTSLHFYRKAIDTEIKKLGKTFIETHRGELWMFSEARPFLEAKFGLAIRLEQAGQTDSATREMEEILELNQGDNQGIRYALASILLHHKKLHRFKLLHERFRKEESTFWLMHHALFLYATEGPGKKAEQVILKALRRNKHFKGIMSGREHMPDGEIDSYSPGSIEEASLYLMDNWDSWEKYPGGPEWLARNVHRS